MDKVPAVMTNEELENAQICLRKELIDIKKQLEEYKTTKKYLDELDHQDEKWFKNAKYALRIKGHHHSLVLKEIGIRNSKAKQGNKKFSEFFVECAIAYLDKTTFEKIRYEADETRKKFYADNPSPGLIKVDY